MLLRCRRRHAARPPRRSGRRPCAAADSEVIGSWKMIEMRAAADRAHLGAVAVELGDVDRPAPWSRGSSNRIEPDGDGRGARQQAHDRLAAHRLARARFADQRQRAAGRDGRTRRRRRRAAMPSCTPKSTVRFSTRSRSFIPSLPDPPREMPIASEIGARRLAQRQARRLGGARGPLDDIVKAVERGIDLDRAAAGRADGELHPAVGAVALGREVAELHAVEPVHSTSVPAGPSAQSVSGPST